MPVEPIDISSGQARRLAVAKQGLSGPLPRTADKSAILDAIRKMAYVQWDPVSVVAPSHQLVVWSRVGSYHPIDLEDLQWKEKQLFQGWGHAASLVLTEDYPLHYSLMKRYPECLSSGWGKWKRWARVWIPKNRRVRTAILQELRSGPKTVSQFRDHAKTRRTDGAWSSASDVSDMLFHMWMGGEVMIVGHEGRTNVWGLSEEFLPCWVDKKSPPPDEVERRFAERSLRALGVATKSEIHITFPNGHYLDLTGALKRLEAESTIHRVRMEGRPNREVRYIHQDDVESLESLESRAWQPRTSILSPFDNLIAARGRVSQLFGFDYAHENYVPKEKRKFGVYVMPILKGDRFLGRIAPRTDRERHRLVIEGVHAEASATLDRATGEEVAEQIEGLAKFLGCSRVDYPGKVPRGWRGSLS
jgi:uncharacterized protein